NKLKIEKKPNGLPTRMKTIIDSNQMEETKQEHLKIVDNSKKSILARGCDPALSLQFSKVVPRLIGNPEYVPTTNDADFIEKLKSREWSVIYFAPGACRFSAAERHIPGGNSLTEGWTLEQYRELVHKIQGEKVQFVETPFESEALGLLKKALAKARETN
ncbi:MAG: hypothetical protein ACR2MT_16125, partial [Aurantibacter sp.]